MPKEFDFENLRMCLDNYSAENIFIRGVGSCGGGVKINKNLKDKVLDFEKNSSGLHVLIDSNEVFHFPLKHYFNGFSLAYERFDKNDVIIFSGRGIDPYDVNLPEPKKSLLRNSFDDCLVEINFNGRVDLEFHSWMDEPHWKYWKIIKPNN